MTDTVKAAIEMLFQRRHQLEPDALRSLVSIWMCASAARYGKPYETWWTEEEDFYAEHDVQQCEHENGHRNPDGPHARVTATDPVWPDGFYEALDEQAAVLQAACATGTYTDDMERVLARKAVAVLDVADYPTAVAAIVHDRAVGFVHEQPLDETHDSTWGLAEEIATVTMAVVRAQGGCDDDEVLDNLLAMATWEIVDRERLMARIDGPGAA